MKRIELDLTLFARQLMAKAARLQSDRQRAMIDMFIRHTSAELDGDLDAVMATMNPTPAFHIWFGGSDIGPKGWDAVAAMYAQMFASRSNWFEMDIHRIVIDDDCIVTEFTQRKIMPGLNFLHGPWADALHAQGERADPAGHYLSIGRVVILLPFDDRCRLIGEDGFGGAAPMLRRLPDEELPDAYLARCRAPA